MIVIPAIDLKGGRCVRLLEGREDSAKTYDRDPAEVARAYEKAGARLIHVVDLDGAFLGSTSDNQRIIKRIAIEAGIPIEVGGGIRSLADIETILRKVGARYVVLGTLVVEQPDVVRAALSEFGDSIVVGIDARGTEVATRGWKEVTSVDALELAKRMAEMGVQRIIYTDITRDGRLEGPNLDMTREIARASGVRVTASGGVSTLADIEKLCGLEADGVDSVIVGKALYEGRFTVEQAISAARRAEA
ncbi:MAG TPA: 1-(5-phosphoribosyl)-5-[(5-phosphoribosylamino)methylideneamino]imidazole-4-carboxamide isomerase [Blastocatellia bacterium]|nr:1-(5-phosphoribosyl)-5-[(5-phosphoribosylamino)methylideneamino]imidazole-4-carboxamide isomerase [Blastocatellia bacterium]